MAALGFQWLAFALLSTAALVGVVALNPKQRAKIKRSFKNNRRRYKTIKKSSVQAGAWAAKKQATASKVSREVKRRTDERKYELAAARARNKGTVHVRSHSNDGHGVTSHTRPKPGQGAGPTVFGRGATTIVRPKPAKPAKPRKRKKKSSKASMKTTKKRAKR